MPWYFIQNMTGRHHISPRWQPMSYMTNLYHYIVMMSLARQCLSNNTMSKSRYSTCAFTCTFIA